MIVQLSKDRLRDSKRSPQPNQCHEAHLKVVVGCIYETYVADLVEEKRWSLFGAINRAVHYHVDPATQPENKICLDRIHKEEFCLLTGSRASGKTTRLFWIRTQLDEVGDWSL